MMTTIQRYLLLLGICGVAQALDIEVTSYECDKSLPVYATFKVLCSGQTRCTFGSSRANITGSMYYNSVGNSGIEDNKAYLSAEVELLTSTHYMLDMIEVPLCGDTMTAGANNQNGDCPSDGSYGFSVGYDLPLAGTSEYMTWLDSGWNGKGIIQLYAEKDDNMLIGECVYYVKTYVTPGSGEGGVASKLPVDIPSISAAAAVGIALGSMAAIVLLTLYCYCCVCRKKKQVAEDGLIKSDIHTGKTATDRTVSSAGAKSVKTAASPRVQQLLDPVHDVETSTETATATNYQRMEEATSNEGEVTTHTNTTKPRRNIMTLFVSSRRGVSG
jgi:hypothetical protein